MSTRRRRVGGRTTSFAPAALAVALGLGALPGSSTAPLDAYAATGGAGGAKRPDEVTAILSSGLEPYLEAFRGFEEGMGRTVPHRILPDGGGVRHPGPRVVVTFGGKAAVAGYPDGVAHVYCLAPGTQLEGGGRTSPTTRVYMIPRPAAVLGDLRGIQPELERLTVLYSLPGFDRYIEEMRTAARSYGMQIRRVRVADPADLPDRLRDLAKSGSDAIWLPPDPLLITPDRFTALRAFSASQRIPLFVSSEGLVEEGAVAAVSCSYRAIGIAAARATRAVLDGRLPKSEVYPEASETTLNLAAARQCGLIVPPDAVRLAARVLP
jgi:hypothetical protein